MSQTLMLRKSNCKNCHKCIRHCPVKAIRFADNQAQIIENECILCGQCVVVCPQHAKEIVKCTGRVHDMVRSGVPVYVSLAPSFIANYTGAGIEAMRKALKQLGFTDVEETAIGATIVKREYERIVREERPNILITSCCHSVNLLIQKHFPNLLPYLANTLSPMQAHCQDIKRRHPEAKTVFIGPCLSKKDESQVYPDYVDGVLTFEELSAWMEEEGVILETGFERIEESRARFFPTPGGILKTLTERDPEYTYFAADGIANCIETLKELETGGPTKAVIEMSACSGSCVHGPATDPAGKLPLKGYMYVSRFTGTKDFVVDQPEKEVIHKDFKQIEQRLHQPTEAEIKLTLKKMGKNSKKDELNCGTCGYNSCRDKAIAVCQGKAEITMCLPYLKERAESLSINIITNMPNGIMAFNDALQIQQMNQATADIFGLESRHEMNGHMITDLFSDPSVFIEALETQTTCRENHVYLEEYDKYVNLCVVNDKDGQAPFALIEDITEREKIHAQKELLRKQTEEVADRVVEKQMRIVQEIASLLGETTAETKIALYQLKEANADE